MAPHYWTCPCGTRNTRTKQKCANQTCRRSRPKKQAPKHMVALEETYETYVELNGLIHGCGEECAVCGKEPSQDRRHDRDHGHDRSEVTYGKPRGLACGGDWGCNKVMSRLDLVRARQIVAYLERAEAYWLTQQEEAA